ncbi:MAG: hypothetical protein ACR2K6_01050 [Solirubrobacterales bacterium]
MRKFRFIVAGLILSLAVGVAGAWATGTDTNGTVNQSITLKVKKTTLPNKGKGKGILLGTKVVAENANEPGNVPDPAERVVLNYDDGFSINGKKFPKCKKDLEGTTDQQAQRNKVCGKAQVGEGSATVLLPNASGGATQVAAVVTAFNGPKSQASNGAKGQGFILHTYLPDFGLTTILPGVISGSKLGGGDFGQALNVDVPPLAGGAGGIETFQANIKARIFKRIKGKRKRFDYVTGKCNEKTLDVSGKFEYQNSPNIIVADSVVCTRKK